MVGVRRCRVGNVEHRKTDSRSGSPRTGRCTNRCPRRPRRGLASFILGRPQLPDARPLRRRRRSRHRDGGLRQRRGRCVGGGGLLRASAPRRRLEPRLRLLTLERRWRRHAGVVAVVLYDARHGLVDGHEAAEGTCNRPVDGVEQRAETVHGRRANGARCGRDAETTGNGVGRRQPPYDRAVAAARRLRRRLVAARWWRGEGRGDGYSRAAGTVHGQRRRGVDGRFARRKRKQCRSGPRQLQQDTHTHAGVKTLKIKVTSGYATVVHGRPKTPKNTSFLRVTQPPGVAQPLYSRGHN